MERWFIYIICSKLIKMELTDNVLTLVDICILTKVDLRSVFNNYKDSPIFSQCKNINGHLKLNIIRDTNSHPGSHHRDQRSLYVD
jgi:hypothetical protein